MWEVILLGIDQDAIVARLRSFDAASRLCSRLCSRLPMGAVDCVVLKRKEIELGDCTTNGICEIGARQ